MLKDIIYQIQLGIKRGEGTRIESRSEGFLSDLLRSEINSANDIKTNIKQSDAAKLLDHSLISLFKIKETPTKSELGRGMFEAKKLLLAAEIFNYSLLKHASNFAAERALKIGKKYFVLEVVFQANKIIYNNTRYFNNSKRRIVAYKEFEEYLEYYKIERALDIGLIEILVREQKSPSRDEETAKLCGDLLKKYEKYQNKIPSLLFHDALFSLQYYKAFHEKSIRKVYEVARAKTTYFLNLDFNYMPGLIHGYSIQLVYLIQTKAYTKGEKLLAEAQSILPQNTLGHFNFLSIVVKLKLYSGRYEEAISIVFKTLSHKKFDLMQPVFKRHWYLYEAYVNLLLETGHATYEGRRRRFSIQRFINDLPSFSKDKKAMNIPILVAQMLFFITRKQYNKAIDRIESLGKYTSRYLRNDETFRSMCFIKMILEIPKWSFNQLRVERATYKLYQRLQASEMDLIYQPFEIEVIPYETLWEIIMDELRPDHNYTPKRSGYSRDQQRGMPLA